MIWTHRGRPIPLEAYHGVPKGWRADEIMDQHAILDGTFDLRGPDATEPGAPAWLPERNAWLQYRQTLYRIADGVLVGDPACVELAIRYIELRYIGSYSGFVRSLLSRRLKHVAVTPQQRSRLHKHFSDLVLREERTQEFRDYAKLWSRLITDNELQGLAGALRAQANGEAKATYILRLLRPNPAFNRTSTGDASRRPAATG